MIRNTGHKGLNLMLFTIGYAVSFSTTIKLRVIKYTVGRKTTLRPPAELDPRLSRIYLLIHCLRSPPALFAYALCLRSLPALFACALNCLRPAP